MTQVSLMLYLVGFLCHPICGVHNHRDNDYCNGLGHKEQVFGKHPVWSLSKDRNENPKYYCDHVVSNQPALQFPKLVSLLGTIFHKNPND
jgi:hypothetical protein